MFDTRPTPYPLRQKSAHGVPAERNQFARTCKTCRASFLGLAPGQTGERGIWRDWSWYCSAECDPKTKVES